MNNPPRSDRQLHRLRVWDALQQGWKGFMLAPWVLVGFQGLWAALVLLCGVIQDHFANLHAKTADTATALAALICLGAGVLLILWGWVGMIKGSRCVLSGQQPRLSAMAHWDGAGMARIARSYGILMALLCSLIIPIMALRILVLGLEVQPVLGLVPFVLAIVLLSYVAVNQLFLGHIMLFQNLGSLEAIQSGRRVVDGHWFQVFILLVIELLLATLGLLAYGFGLIVVTPLIICITTAAYRQLYSPTQLAH